MFGFFKKKTTDLVEEWQKVMLVNEFANNKNISEEDKKSILVYINDNKSELTVVLSSLAEAARQKNGDNISKELFHEVLKWIHSVVWPSLIMGFKAKSNFRKSFDHYMESYKKFHDNPEEALAKYNEIMGTKE